jgi:hypothetical protein
MADLTTGQIFVNGEKNITHTKLNNIIGLATVSSDVIALKPGAIASVSSYLLMYDGTTQLKKVNVGNLVNVANLGTGTNGFGVFASQSGNTYNFYRIKGDPSTLTITQEGNDLLLTVIGSTGIADGSVTTIKIAAGAVTLAKMATGSVDAPQLVANAVTTAAIAAGAVVTASIATGAVTSASILDGTIVSADMAVGAVAATNIAANAVVTAGILDGNVTYSKLDAVPMGIASPRNSIRNADMKVAQRGTSLAAVASGAYTLDGWVNQKSGASVTTVSQQIVDLAPVSTAPYNRFALRQACTTANAAPGATDFHTIQHKVEGNMAEPLFGQSTSLSFWVRASKTGSFTACLKAGGQDAYYKHLFVISSANTWQRFTLNGITAFSDGSIGTWNRGTGLYYTLDIVLMAGTTFTNSTNDAWTSGNVIAATGQTNFVSTTSDTFDLTMVQHEPGSTATMFIPDSVDAGLSKNLRYAWATTTNTFLGFSQSAQNLYSLGLTFIHAMRAAPTLVNGAFTVGSGSAGTVGLVSPSVYTTGFQNASNNWTVNVSVQLNSGAILTAEL